MIFIISTLYEYKYAIKRILMNFSEPYHVLGTLDDQLVENVCIEIQKMNDEFFNYIDNDTKTGAPSWHRLDFAPDSVQHEREKSIHAAGIALVNHAVEKFNLDEVSSFSVSMLKPRQVLEEHTDSRLIHRLTNRYIIPLIDGGGSYNYWIVGGKQVKHYLKRGEIFRVNNAVIHSAVNVGEIERYNILIDTFAVRLKEKFKRSIDLAAPMSKEGHIFSLARKAVNKNDKKIHQLTEKAKLDPNFRI